MSTLLPPNVKVHLALGYVDMRKGIDGLSVLVQEVLHQDPFTGHLFVSVHFSHTCLLLLRPRSVLTGKFAGEEDGDVERDRFTGARRRGVLASPS